MGGKRIEREGYFVEPTVFTGVRDEMVIAREEIFGPVICILKFSTLDEVIRRANDCDYGLMAGVFTKSMATATRCANELKTGFVNVNRWFAMGMSVPLGGVKGSGFGREFGNEGLNNYLESKTVVYGF